MAGSAQPYLQDATQQLCALITGRLAPTALSASEWAAVAALALDQHLAAVLYFTVIVQAPRWRHAGKPAEDLLRQQCIKAAATTALQQDEAARWATLFRDHGIDATWLKGIPLSLIYYPSRLARTMADIDVLVPRDQVEAVLDLIATETGRPVPFSPFMANWNYETGADVGRAHMDIHWGMVEVPGSRVAPDLDWFMAKRTTLDLLGTSMTVLAPEAMLLHLCAHAILQHGEENCQLQRYFDLHCVITRTPELDWDEIVAQAARWRWAQAVERALSNTQNYFGTPLPADLLARLLAARSDGESPSWIAPRPYKFTRWQYLRLRMAMLSPGARLTFATAYLFPPPAHMVERYRLSHRWQLPGAYVRRWVELGYGALEVVTTRFTRLD